MHAIAFGVFGLDPGRIRFFLRDLGRLGPIFRLAALPFHILKSFLQLFVHLGNRQIDASRRTRIGKLQGVVTGRDPIRQFGDFLRVATDFRADRAVIQVKNRNGQGDEDEQAGPGEHFKIFQRVVHRGLVFLLHFLEHEHTIFSDRNEL